MQKTVNRSTNLESNKFILNLLIHHDLKRPNSKLSYRLFPACISLDLVVILACQFLRFTIS